MYSAGFERYQAGKLILSGLMCDDKPTLLPKVGLESSLSNLCFGGSNKVIKGCVGAKGR